jgi:hypothetical protein
MGPEGWEVERDKKKREWKRHKTGNERGGSRECNKN